MPLTRIGLPFGEMFDQEVAATGPAGSLMIYKTDVLHRGSAFKAPNRSRFAMLIDYQERGWRWTGKMAWANSRRSDPGMTEALTRMTPRQRDLVRLASPIELRTIGTAADAGRRGGAVSADGPDALWGLSGLVRASTRPLRGRLSMTNWVGSQKPSSF